LTRTSAIGDHSRTDQIEEEVSVIKSKPKLVCAIFVFSLAFSTGASGETSSEASDALGPIRPFTVEGYYKIRWGHYEEFLSLFKKNHWPVLRAGIEAGAILEVSASSPRYHAPEDGRWDLRISIVWRNPIVATSSGGEATEAVLKRLFPNREEFDLEEQRRFELIEEHIDVPVLAHDTSTW
jgi:hypothetical protein